MWEEKGRQIPRGTTTCELIFWLQIDYEMKGYQIESNVHS
jgi:hypothetical protein